MQHRKSRQRERILEVLKETDSHPTADWVYKRLKEEIPGLSLGTVYRNLSVLMEQGQIKKLPFGSTFDRYDAKTDPHYHFVCEKCSKVEDIQLPLFKDIDEQVRKVSDFTVLSHKLEFFGICKECSNNCKSTNH